MKDSLWAKFDYVLVWPFGRRCECGKFCRSSVANLAGRCPTCGAGHAVTLGGLDAAGRCVSHR